MILNETAAALAEKIIVELGQISRPELEQLIAAQLKAFAVDKNKQLSQAVLECRNAQIKCANNPTPSNKAQAKAKEKHLDSLLKSFTQHTEKQATLV